SLIARIMWARDLVPPASIARVVPHQHRQQLDRIIVRFHQLTGLWQQEEGMKRVLNAVERILFSQPFSPGQAVESSSVCVRELSPPPEKPGPNVPPRSPPAPYPPHSPGNGRRPDHLFAEPCHSEPSRIACSTRVDAPTAQIMMARGERTSAPAPPFR